MFESLLQNEYGLHLRFAQRSSTGAGSDTWFLRCEEGDYVLKFPARSAINHPETEPELCALLRKNGIPACEFLKNSAGEYISRDDAGRMFTVHPAIWEITRSFVYDAPCCAEGKIDEALFSRYIDAYCRYGTLNEYDRENMQRLYLYQIAVCDYYGQYYASDAENRDICLQQARLATKLLQNTPLV